MNEDTDKTPLEKFEDLGRKLFQVPKERVEEAEAEVETDTEECVIPEESEPDE